MKLILQCQQKAVLDQMGHPVCIKMCLYSRAKNKHQQLIIYQCLMHPNEMYRVIHPVRHLRYLIGGTL